MRPLVASSHATSLEARVSRQSEKPHDCIPRGVKDRQNDGAMRVSSRHAGRTLLAVLASGLPAAVACGLSACGLVFDLDALGSGGPVVTDAADAANVDAADEDARPERFCVTSRPVPVFCADFDEGDIRAGWDNAKFTPDPLVNGGGRTDEELELGRPRDGTRAVTFRVPAVATGESGGVAYFLRVFSERADLVETEVAFRMNTADPRPVTRSVPLFGMDFGLSGSAGGVLLARDGAGYYVAVLNGKTLLARQSIAPLAAEKWTNLRIGFRRGESVEGGTAAADIKVFVEGARVFELDLPAELVAPPVYDVWIGAMQGVGPYDALSVSFDDFRVLGP
jgi:hypothetical protein